MRIAVVANLDAECELMRPQSYRPSSRMIASMVARAGELQQQLTACFDAAVAVLVPGRGAGASGPYDHGWCWCPTPSALACLRAGAAPLPPAPALAVLQQVNHRAFAAAMSPRLPGARFVRSLGELEEVLAAARPAHGHFLKRPFGFAGRARKLVPPTAPLTGALRTWAAAAMHDYGGGLQVEPRVLVEADFALHGIVDRAGALVLGQITRQRVGADGAWLASYPAAASDVDAGERQALQTTANDVARALHAAGYFGPFGIDAYRYLDATGGRTLHPLSEINARLSMGWAVGLGSAARELWAISAT